MTQLVVDILSKAARQCSVTAPSNWVSSTNAAAVELRDFLSETVDDILQRVDMVAPIGKAVTITGTGVESYALPADYKRLKRDQFSVYEQFSSRRACVPVPSNGEWEYMKDMGAAGAYRFYRVHGYEGNFEIDFYRLLASGDTAYVSYVSDAWVMSSADVQKSEFSAIDDVSLIPARLLETGIVWRFRDRKGLEFASKMAEYEMLLARMANDTRTARSVVFGGIKTRGPFDIPVPDYIPSGA